MTDELLISPEEGARRIAMGRSVFWDLMRRGLIPSVKIGRSRRVAVRELETFVQRKVDEAAVENEP